MYNVIIVDDEHMILLSLQKLLEGLEDKFSIAGVAEDGQEALHLLDNHSIDIVITDICMPEMDGLELIEKARNIDSKIKFIIISGYDDFSYAQTAIRFGVSDFILKPIVPDQILSIMDNMYSQMQTNKRSYAENNDWILLLETYKKELVEHIWTFNKAETFEKINDVVEGHNRIPNHPLSLSQLLEDLLRDIENELINRNPNLPNLLPEQITWSNMMTDTTEIAKQAVSRMIDFVQGSRNLGSRQNILKAVEYIEAYFASPDFSLQEVADYIGVSESYFSRSFKEEMNISFIKYVIHIRMAKAKELIQNADMSITKIAFEVGFSDYPHFSKSFKKYYGLTPNEYRKQL
ncbi:response regulator [Gracilibacillus caseinilyticus]|uniref:Response regulator n=1 Tax=Gracilibacillus caseinilyticus TaxID=2932256 RepID=A0ABY4ETW0_9BACI|nr:response regulator [Gracilibacillus caseinilyticus]UOQ47653.1 response regulator [Gracilibacillus caseinilyticus]